MNISMNEVSLSKIDMEYEKSNYLIWNAKLITSLSSASLIDQLNFLLNDTNSTSNHDACAYGYYWSDSLSWKTNSENKQKQLIYLLRFVRFHF